MQCMRLNNNLEANQTSTKPPTRPKTKQSLTCASLSVRLFCHVACNSVTMVGASVKPNNKQYTPVPSFPSIFLPCQTNCNHSQETNARPKYRQACTCSSLPSILLATPHESQPRPRGLLLLLRLGLFLLPCSCWLFTHLLVALTA